jgi:putative ubiquitin-RnfH superfamily antitoxin RatB of RatAB toxin-antitoxin module
VKVLVALALPGRQWIEEVSLPEGATVEQAIAASALASKVPQLDLARLRVGIWARPCTRDAVLREGDRVELYRPLVADPKAARRERARKPR